MINRQYIQKLNASLLILFVSIAASRADVLQVEMRDGVHLATEILLPQSHEKPFPTVLVRSVYGRTGRPFADKLNKGGIAYVIQDTRGRGDSEGEDRVFADDGWGKRQDGVDTIKWIQRQDWSNGKVATWGYSALGITQNILAGATQELTCQTMGVTPASFYGEVAYQGGVFRKNMMEVWLKGQGNPHMVDVYHAHPSNDEFWASFDVKSRAPYITAPAVHIGGWFGPFRP